LNATLSLDALERLAAPDAPGAALLAKAAESLSLSARVYHRTLKVARTIADLDGSDAVRRIQIAEALSLKRRWASADQAGFAKVS
jgi:magnesium chelatase family protein